MKIKVGLNDSLREKIKDSELSLLLLLEDDNYFCKKILEFKKDFKQILLNKKTNQKKLFPYGPLIDLNEFTGTDEYIEKIGNFCCKEYHWPFETFFSIRTLVECGYWLPISRWQNESIRVLTAKQLNIEDVFSQSNIYIEISKDVGITNLKKYLEKNYKKISKSFKDVDPSYGYVLKGINQPNLDINKKIFKLRNQKPPIKYSEIAKIINDEYSRANYNESNLRNTYKAYIKSIRNLRK